MISIICVYNDELVFRNWLLKSLQNQTAEYELVALDNSSGRFSSAAQALNYGARQTKKNSRYFMFVHQDIDLMSDAWLAETEKTLDRMPRFGIAGVAGKSKNNRRCFTNIIHGTSPPCCAGQPVKEFLELMTVDECLFVVPRFVFESASFDEVLCDGWHLYAVDYCLRMKTLGKGVFLLPVVVHHKSLGCTDKSYYRALGKILCAYRTKHFKIYTTCGAWSTRVPLCAQRTCAEVMKKVRAFMRILIDRGLVPNCLRRKNRVRFWQFLKANKNFNQTKKKRQDV